MSTDFVALAAELADDLQRRREALRRALERLQELKRMPIYPFEHRR